MKTLTTILVVISLSGCYTKKQAVKKFCSTTVVDTVVIRTDTIVLDSTHTDTIFSSRVDSIFIQQGKLSIKYIKVRDSVYLSGKYDADTIVRVDTLKVSIPVTVPNGKQSGFDVFKNYWYWLLVAYVVGLTAPIFFRR
mgnify:CR=1 FL=1